MNQLKEKTYFKIGEVSSILKIKPHVLRYWESEFPTFAPKKSQKGQRLYRREEVETLFHIKYLIKF